MQMNESRALLLAGVVMFSAVSSVQVECLRSGYQCAVAFVYTHENRRLRQWATFRVFLH